MHQHAEALTPAEQRTALAAVERLPYRQSMPHHPGPIARDTGTLTRWLDAYSVHAQAEAAKVAAERDANRRAGTVLRGLRPALVNALDEAQRIEERETPPVVTLTNVDPWDVVPEHDPQTCPHEHDFDGTCHRPAGETP